MKKNVQPTAWFCLLASFTFHKAAIPARTLGKKKPAKPWLLAVWISITLTLFHNTAHSGQPTPVTQEQLTTRYTIKLPAQSVADSLNALAQQTGAQFLFPYHLAKTRPANAVSGRYTLEEAVQRLLKGSGLVSGFDQGILVISIDGAQGSYDQNTEGIFDMKSKKNLLAATVAFFVGGGSGGVWSQDISNEDASEFLLEEVIVTAQKRQQSLNDVPISINAFGAERLRASRVGSVDDIAVIASGIRIGGNVKHPNITIRGVGASGNNPGFDSGTAVHVDGVYLGQRTALTSALYDMERIEVLRGPQGTLYGRNATGGAVNIITKAPSEDVEFGGGITVGNYDLLEAEGFLNTPISDRSAVRIAFKTVNHDSYTDNLFDINEHDDAESVAMRAKLKVDFSEDLMANLTFDYSHDTGMDAAVNSRFDPDIPTNAEAAGGFLPGGRKVNNNDTDSSDVEQWGATLRFDWDINGMSLASITGYRASDYSLKLDQDGTDIFNFRTKDQHRDDVWQLSQEFNLASDSGGDIDWLVGLFYYKDAFNESILFNFPVGDEVGDFGLGINSLKTEAVAVFGEATFHITERFRATAGVRYSQEERSIDEFLADGTNTGDDEWDSVTPKLTLSYDLAEDTMLYSTISQGFKAGGFNGYSLQQAFDPEEVTNYELGLKGRFFDGRVDFSAAAFYMDYSDLQVEQRQELDVGGTITTVTVVDNAAESTISGVELDFLARVTEQFTLGGNFSYLDATYDKFDAIDGTRGENIFDVSGNQLSFVPEISYHINAEYQLPVSAWGHALARVEYTYQDEVFFTPFEDAVDVISRVSDSYGLVNASLTFVDESEVWRISLFGKNLTDEEVVNFGLSFPPGQLVFYDSPRTYGLSVSYNL